MLAKIICLIFAVKCVFAAPPTDVVPLEKQQPTVIPIIAQSEEFESNGTFKYSYETANGIKREETSYDKVLPQGRSGGSSDGRGEDKSDESNEIHVQQGSYSYTAPDGTVITVRYIADENGFRPIGDHLPKPPSILTAATARNADRSKKPADNLEDSSVPAPAVALSPRKASKELKTPEISARIATSADDAFSSEGNKNLTSIPEAISISESDASTNGANTDAAAATTQAISSAADATVSPTEAASSPTETAPSTTESALTTESASTTTAQLSELTSTASEQSTSEPATTHQSPNPEEPATTLVAYTSDSSTQTESASPNSEVTTEIVTTASR